jgi:HD-GYP domain-containing protein (c-di-GMP phosphodiesterase class II)
MKIVAGPVTDEMRAVANALLKTIEHYDPAIAEHLDAVASLSGRLATALGFGEQQAAIVALAGRLHDVGKIAVSRHILLKPSSLDELEWREVRMHPVHGFTILCDLASLRDLAALTRSHHERIDGTGYPDRLFGYEIPLESRIVAVADAFHAMTVARPYARTKEPEEALHELRRCSGTQFDGEIVDTFIDMLGARGRFERASA